MLMKNIVKKKTKKEESNNRLFKRQLVSTGGKNPFLTSNKYVDDLHVQDNYLRPINSNNEK